mmetsp:Transcript_4624/g.13979  ORF Transcript_4624/g.13979 Transcript_4624/m.13979 type:complete len:202 (+) Transcript_4624:804-1409(+)
MTSWFLLISAALSASISFCSASSSLSASFSFFSCSPWCRILAATSTFHFICLSLVSFAAPRSSTIRAVSQLARCFSASRLQHLPSMLLSSSHTRASSSAFVASACSRRVPSSEIAASKSPGCPWRWPGSFAVSCAPSLPTTSALSTISARTSTTVPHISSALSFSLNTSSRLASSTSTSSLCLVCVATLAASNHCAVLHVR